MFGKAELLTAIAPTNRGISANAQQRAQILAAVARLEEHNPTPHSVTSPLLAGDWRLLYTSSQELLGLDRIPLLNLGPIYQSIRTENSKLYNLAEVTGLPLIEGLVSVVASFVAVSPQRVNVQFERFVVGPQRLMGYRDPATYIDQLSRGDRLLALDWQIPTRQPEPTESPDQPVRQGWVEITYLDSDLRIGRGNEGSVFVLQRV
jgi:hypothetical protein